MRRLRFRWVTSFGGVLIAVSWLLFMSLSNREAAVAYQGPPQPLAEPPKDQTYIGAKQCAACHFDQFLTWRQTKHAKGFEILPAKYQADASCLKCHATGLGEATGFASLAKTPDLVGTSCEACHGPGSKHGEIAKGYGTKKLTPEEVAYVKSTIHKVRPSNACATCHLPQGHKQHPPYTK
jgi:hypothetical protein